MSKVGCPPDAVIEIISRALRTSVPANHHGQCLSPKRVCWPQTGAGVEGHMLEAQY